MITREQAIEILRKHLKTENTIKHMIATEAIMKILAKRFEPEKETEWAMAGLLHDLDYETMTDNKEHGIKTVEMLKAEGIDLPESIFKTIKAHAYDYNQTPEPENKMEWSIFICDSLTGLIVATALVRPSKKLADVKVKSVMKKFKDKGFAAGTRREEIALCEEKLGIPLREFVELSLEAMKAVSDELGL